MNLRRAGEDRLLREILPSLPVGKKVIGAAGDDCAVVHFDGKKRLLLLKTDCVVERIHFETTAEPFWIGWKAMMRPLSDFAAMSGVPQFGLITLIVPKTKSIGWVKKTYNGINSAAKKFEVSIVGGETSNTKGPVAISISVAGFVEKDRWISRNGGRAGDDIFVTGRLGGSRRGKHLRFVPRIEESRWLTKNFRVHAMIDLSDGLGADLPRLARASRLDFEIDESKLPLNRGAKIENAIADGEDYEILFAISPRDRNRLTNSWRTKFPKLALTRIGTLHQTSNIRHQALPRGYVHFK